MVKIRFENSPKLLRSMKEKGWGSDAFFFFDNSNDEKTDEEIIRQFFSRYWFIVEILYDK